MGRTAWERQLKGAALRVEMVETEELMWLLGQVELKLGFEGTHVHGKEASSCRWVPLDLGGNRRFLHVRSPRLVDSKRSWAATAHWTQLEALEFGGVRGHNWQHQLW